jgi:hypothetical protein
MKTCLVRQSTEDKLVCMSDSLAEWTSRGVDTVGVQYRFALNRLANLRVLRWSLGLGSLHRRASHG